MAFEVSEPLAQRLFEEVRAETAARVATPLSTYRLQLHKGFRLGDARALVPYLSSLGVTHLYTSPLLRAAPGSTHGYDVIDHACINPELGTEEDLTALAEELRAHGMGLVLDTVPNHMSIEKGHNALWNDVLENGPSSVHARVFDIDWDPVKEELKGKVLLPILGDQYGVVLERGELKLDFQGGAFVIRYYDHTLPVAPRQYATLLRHRIDELERRLGPGDPDVVELHSIITAVDHLPPPTTTERSLVLERNREKEVIKRRLAALASKSAAIREFIAGNVEVINGRPEEPSSFDLLDRILSSCSYRLAHWRVAGEEINYRRFFDINGLAAIRVEDREVFDEAHQLVFRWLAEGKVQGLRIDHPDGLFDPTAYFSRLQEEYFVQQARARRPESTRGGAEAEAAWRDVEDRIRALFHQEFERDPDSPMFRALYVVVEKIQGGRERIPDRWAVHGTTGYRFANSVTGLFIPGANETILTRIWERFIGGAVDFDALGYEKKRLVLGSSMASEINVLARELNRISEMDRRTRDFTLFSLRRALVEFVALFPVYRTYIDDRHPIDERDRQYIRWTVERARRKDPIQNASIFDFLEDVLLGNYPAHLREGERRTMLRFAMRLQQLTGPVMAKGLEDTVFYVYNRLAALNEVGGEPERFGTPVETFHLRNQERSEKWPSAFLASSTHDTKRSEDVRARMCVLAEVPEQWQEHLRDWSRLNARHKTMLRDRPVPDPNEEYLFYQTVLGAYPMGNAVKGRALDEFRQRIAGYMLKAIREAKVNTSWVNPDPAYEEAMRGFVEGALDEEDPAFLDSLYEFKKQLEEPGQINSLGGILLKIASPGVPDTYQGCETWDLSLVDPDNRRPVDFAQRRRALEEITREAEVDRAALSRRLVASLHDGRIKLYVIAESLRLRKRLPELFRRGGYRPLDVVGGRADHAVAMARQLEGRWVLAVVPRLVMPLLGVPGGLGSALAGTCVRIPRQLAQIRLREVFTGRSLVAERRGDDVVLDLGSLFGPFPVALLESASP
jgi:(1->4)-alpha-D-glucan 1-alpha-D-glucosylmutase